MVERSTRRRPVDLDGPSCPLAAAHVWAWFLELSARRQGSGFGVNPVGWTDVAAWASLTGVRPTPWEMDLLGEAESAYMRMVSARGAKK